MSTWADDDEEGPAIAVAAPQEVEVVQPPYVSFILAI